MDVSMTLRRLPCLAKQVPERLYRRYSTSKCGKTPERPSNSSKSAGSNDTKFTSSTISTKEDAIRKMELAMFVGRCKKHRRKRMPCCLACRRVAAGIITPPNPSISKAPDQANIFFKILLEWNGIYTYLTESSPVEEPFQTTIQASKKNSKIVRFVDGLEEEVHDKSWWKNFRANQEINRAKVEMMDCELKENGPATGAMVVLPSATFEEVVKSLRDDIRIVLKIIRAGMHQKDGPRLGPILHPAELDFLKRAFLRFLDEKTDSQYLCRDCDNFHNKPLRKISSKAPQNDKCATLHLIGYGLRKDRVWQKSFCFSQAQFAMKLFRKDSYKGKERLQNLDSSGVINISTRFTHLRTSEMFAVSDRLLSRIQHWHHSSPEIENPYSKAELAQYCMRDFNVGNIASLCKHLTDKKEHTPRYVLWDFENEENNPNVKRCDDCALEYRYDWYDAGEHGSGLVLTIWRDFGKCLTPFDPRWMAHFEEYEDPEYIARYKKDLETAGPGPSSEGWKQPRWHEDMELAATNWHVGEIQRMFEAGAEFDLQFCVEAMMERDRERPSLFGGLPDMRWSALTTVSHQQSKCQMRQSEPLLERWPLNQVGGR